MPHAYLTIGHTKSSLTGYIDDGVMLYIRSQMSFAVEGAEIAKSQPVDFSDRESVQRALRLQQWDGRKYLISEVRREFQTGLVPRMMRLLTECRVDFAVQDNRNTKIERQWTPLRLEYAMRDYQSYAIHQACVSGMGVLRVGTGGGKTRIGLGILSHLERPSLFLVTQRSLMYQAGNVFQELLQYPDQVGYIGDGQFDPRYITIATIQSLCAALGLETKKKDSGESEKAIKAAHQHKDLIEATIARAQVVIFDEVHHVAADTAYEIMGRCINADYRFGLSATDWRDDGADMMIEAACGPRIVNIPLSDLVARQVLVPAKIEMHMMAEHAQGPYYGPEQYAAVYNYFYAKNRAFAHQVADINARWLREGRTVLTLVTAVQHGKSLEQLHHELGLPAVFLSGAASTATRAKVLGDVREGRLQHLIATSIADEGLDLPVLDALNLAGGGKSSTRAYQRIGRVLRPSPGKQYGLVADYRCPDHTFFESQFRTRREIYAQERAFEIISA